MDFVVPALLVLVLLIVLRRKYRRDVENSSQKLRLPLILIGMIGKRKKLSKTVTVLIPAGKIDMTFPLDFKPKEVLAAFVRENKQWFPACHPIPTDVLEAEIVSFGEEQQVWAIRVTGQVAGDRLLSVTAKNYIG